MLSGGRTFPLPKLYLYFIVFGDMGPWWPHRGHHARSHFSERPLSIAPSS